MNRDIIIVNAIMLFMCMVVTYFVLQSVSIDTQCASIFPPYNSTETNELYKHCKAYPSTYGVIP